MDIIRRILPLGRGKGFRVSDYLLATLSDPRLLGQAARHVLTQRSRKVESGLRAATRPELRQPPAGPRVPASLESRVEELAREVHVLVLDRQPGRMTIGVAEVDLLSALVRLTTIAPSVALFIDDEPVSFGSPLFKSRALEASGVEARLTDRNLDPATLLIEAYRKGPGRWVSANARNTIARAARMKLRA